MPHLDVTIYGLGRQLLTAANFVAAKLDLITTSRAIIYTYIVQTDHNKLLIIHCNYQVFGNAYLQEIYNIFSQ